MNAAFSSFMKLVTESDENTALHLLTSFNLGFDGKIHRRRDKVSMMVRQSLAIPAAPPVESVAYRATLANGKDVRVYVQKGGDIFKQFKAEGLEVVSFVKKAA